jgi:hypothetical protein
MASVKSDIGPEDIIQIADDKGVSVTSVSDGTVFVFTRKHLEGMLDACKERNEDKCVVFVRHRVFQN